MKKIFLIAITAFVFTACNNNVKTEQDEQKQRDSMDAAQNVKDSLAVEAKIMADMMAEDSAKSSEKVTPETPKK